MPGESLGNKCDMTFVLRGVCGLVADDKQTHEQL